MKKVALLFHGIVGSKNRWGQVIDYTNSLKTHYNNLYKNETCELDVFMHVWDMNNEVSDEKLMQDFQTTRFVKMQPIPKGGFDELWEILYKNYGSWNGNFSQKNNCIKILERIYSQMYGLYYSNELKKTYEQQSGFKYDFAVKTRYDLLVGWKPNFNDLNPDKFYSLPYNKHDKIHKDKKYNTMTDFFWVTGSKNMDEFVKIAPNFKQYLRNQDFIDFFAGKLEYAWVWHMINSQLYDKIQIQDFIQNPVSLERFFDFKNNSFQKSIKTSQVGCLPFTGWKNKKLYTSEVTAKKMEEIEQKIKESLK